MTGNVVIDLAISALGVAIMAGLARLIFGKVDPSLDLDKAIERLSFDEPDFEPMDWLVDENKKAALARNNAGEIAVITAHGDGLVTRRAGAGRVQAEYRDGALIIDPVDHTTGRVHFAADRETANAWLEHFVQTDASGRKKDREVAS